MPVKYRITWCLFPDDNINSWKFQQFLCWCKYILLSLSQVNLILTIKHHVCNIHYINILHHSEKKNKQPPWLESVSELYRPSDCRLSVKLLPTFEDTGCHAVSVTDLYGRILVCLDWIHYFFFQVAPQLYSRGWVDPIPDPLLLRKSGRTGNRTRSSRSVARNSDHYTAEAVINILPSTLKCSCDILIQGKWVPIYASLLRWAVALA
jgi:hypothetical protein